MIYKNIDFHNVEEIKHEGDGYRMYRFPFALTTQMEEGAEYVSSYSTGIELRFKMKCDEVVLHLRAEVAEEAQVAYIYFGDFQGGWYCSSKVIGREDTQIHIARSQNMDVLKRISVNTNLGFNPEVVRVLLPYGRCIFLGIEGEVEAPEKEDYPKKTYLAYGSSITHGSLALAAPYAYPFQIAKKLSCDYLNMGMAGSARLECSLAEYLINRKDWDFISIEMGINMLHNYDEISFEERVKSFLEIIAKDERPVFVTSIFGYQGELQEKAICFREIVKKYTEKYVSDRFVFTDGLELLNCPYHVSEDLTHPSLEGIQCIADRWYEVMKQKVIM